MSEQSRTIDIVFDGPPGPESGRFVEVERDGRSIVIGAWSQRPDGYWILRIPDPETAAERAKVDEREVIRERLLKKCVRAVSLGLNVSDGHEGLVDLLREIRDAVRAL